MKQKSSKLLDALLLILSMGLIISLIFCPLDKMEVVINGDITTCGVSFFTAFSKSHIIKGNFEFLLYVNTVNVVLIIIFHTLGNLILNNKKSFFYGVVLMIISWIMIFFSNWVLISVNSELFNQIGHVSKQSISFVAIFVVILEIAMVIVRGIRYYNN